MKFVTNLVAGKEYLGDFCSTEKLAAFCKECKLDGYEIICAGDFPAEIKSDMVVGVHLPFFNTWLDLYRKNFDALLEEFGSEECWKQFYMGDSFDAVYSMIESQLDFAHSIGAEYVVMHVCEIGITETLTNKLRFSNQEVISAMCDITNSLFKDKPYKFKLLFENMWWRGFSFTDLEMTKYLLDNTEYSNKGIMLDTGHLLHTNKDIETWDEACDYIEQMLDLHSEFVPYIKGLHLHGTLNGRWAKEFYNNPTEIKKDFWERFAQSYEYVFKVDAHKPFESNRINDIIARITPEYINFEFETKTMYDKKLYIEKQNTVLGR